MITDEEAQSKAAAEAAIAIGKAVQALHDDIRRLPGRHHYYSGDIRIGDWVAEVSVNFKPQEPSRRDNVDSL